MTGRIASNIVWLIVDKALRFGSGLAIGVLVARYLAPDRYGTFTIALAITGILNTVAGLGLQGVVVRDLVVKPHETSSILGSAAILLTLGGGLAFAVGLSAVRLLQPGDRELQLLVAILGSAAIVKSTEIASYWYESQTLSKYTAWTQNAVLMVVGAGKLWVIHTGGTMEQLAVLTTVEVIAAGLLLTYSLRRQGIAIALLRFSRPIARRLIRDGWPALLSNLAILTYMKIDQIMLGQMQSSAMVGIYTAAVRISEIWYFIPAIIVASIFPTMVETRQSDLQRFHEQQQQLYTALVWGALTIAVITSLCASQLISLLFGDAYQAAGPVLTIHIWTSVFVFLGVASNQWFLIENRQILSLQRTVLGAVINVALNLMLIPRYGMYGAAGATLAAQFVVGFLCDALQPETRPMFRMKCRAFNPASMRMTRAIA